MHNKESENKMELDDAVNGTWHQKDYFQGKNTENPV